MGQLVGGQLGRIEAVGATYTLIEFSEKVFVGVWAFDICEWKLKIEKKKQKCSKCLILTKFNSKKSQFSTSASEIPSPFLAKKSKCQKLTQPFAGRTCWFSAGFYNLPVTGRVSRRVDMPTQNTAAVLSSLSSRRRAEGSNTGLLSRAQLGFVLEWNFFFAYFWDNFWQPQRRFFFFELLPSIRWTCWRGGLLHEWWPMVEG